MNFQNKSPTLCHPSKAKWTPVRPGRRNIFTHASWLPPKYDMSLWQKAFFFSFDWARRNPQGARWNFQQFNEAPRALRYGLSAGPHFPQKFQATKFATWTCFKYIFRYTYLQIFLNNLFVDVIQIFTTNWHPFKINVFFYQLISHKQLFFFTAMPIKHFCFTNLNPFF